MSIAVCMYGLSGSIEKFGAGSYIDPSISFQNYMDNLFYNQRPDFFLHSWSLNQKEKLIDLYKPISSKFENQEKFSHISLSDYSLEHLITYGDLFSAYGKEGALEVVLKQIEATHSRWKSTKKSVDLLVNCVKETKKVYEGVFILRFDLFFCNKQDMNNLNSDQFICCKRSKDEGYAIDDLFFYSSYENIVKFSNLYDRITKYSVRAPFAAKQHLDYLGIKPNEKWVKNKDYILTRDYLLSQNHKTFKSMIKQKFKKLIFYK